MDGAGTAPGSGTALDPYTSVSDALGRATTVPGDTVLVAPGTYANESLDYGGKDVAVISSDGAASTVLTAPPIRFAAGVTRFPVARFTGGEGAGAGITNGAPTFTGCTFTGLTANRSGAAVYVDGGAVTFD